jgi:hypothetical protein
MPTPKARTAGRGPARSWPSRPSRAEHRCVQNRRSRLSVATPIGTKRRCDRDRPRAQQPDLRQSPSELGYGRLAPSDDNLERAFLIDYRPPARCWSSVFRGMPER